MTDDPRKTDSGAETPATDAVNSGGNGAAPDTDKSAAETAKPYVDPSIVAEATNDSAPPTEPTEDNDDALPLTEEQKRIVELEEEVAALKDRAMRALADADNAQKRAAREVSDSRKYGATGLARDILSVADNLGRALQAVPEVAQEEDQNLFNLRTGVDMTLNEMLQALERHGVKKVTPETGERFDHNMHQAMFEVPADELAPGAVAQVVQDGYVMHDRLLRPALVGVAKKSPEEGAEKGDDDESSDAA